MLAFLLRTVTGQSILAALALLVVIPVAYNGWKWKVARDGAAAAIARVLEETQSESLRRLQMLDVARKNAERREEALAEAAADRQKLMGKIDALSRANDDRACLDVDGVLRLDSLRGRPASTRTRKHAR
jgi:hypothetical protein